METLEKKEQLNQLYDMYSVLLTDKQNLSFKYYYQDDYSLHEIAEILGVSRHAIFDQLKKVENHLYAYEEKLSLLENKQKRLALIDKLESVVDSKLLVDLRKLDE